MSGERFFVLWLPVFLICGILCLFLFFQKGERCKYMQWVRRNRGIKYVLIFAAFCIAAFFLVFSNILVGKLKEEASAKMSVWAEAMMALNKADENTDLNLVLNVINNNNSIPVIVLNEKGEIEQCRNISFSAKTADDSIAYLYQRMEQMRRDGYAIKIKYDDSSSEYMTILYEDSTTLKQLTLFPYVQIAILLIFILIIIVSLLNLKKAEQNRVWVGLTKETAHQLGTPISSLMAWEEMLKESYPDDPILQEMEKDVARLQLIADRFSKVGSVPELVRTELREVVWHVVSYITKRSSNKVRIHCSLPSVDVYVQLCSSLFEWVVENLCKNAIDSMEGAGNIYITMHEITEMVVLEISDTGKGIPKNQFRTVFAPGFTTKKRGWGLGLSLSKRIIEEYHHGLIYVKSSEVGKGTTFRIELKLH